jgi:hypothetical protein
MIGGSSSTATDGRSTIPIFPTTGCGVLVEFTMENSSMAAEPLPLAAQFHVLATSTGTVSRLIQSRRGFVEEPSQCLV